MAPGNRTPHTPEQAPIQATEHSFIIPEVFAEYGRRVPELVAEFTDDELVGRGNDIRFKTSLTRYEDGYYLPDGRPVVGMFEPHIRKLSRSDVFLQQRRSIFDQLVNDGVEPKHAERQATQTMNRMVIPHVEDAHDPIVQKAIANELLTRAHVSATSSAPASYARFKDQVISKYRGTEVAYPWGVAQELFSRAQVSYGGRSQAVSERHFDLFAALGGEEPDDRAFIVAIDGDRVSATLEEAKMRLVYAWHIREVKAGLKFGRKLDVKRIREKFEPLYNKLGYEYQEAQEYVLPSRAREAAITGSIALRASGQAVGRGVKLAAENVKVESVAPVVSMGLGLSLLIPAVASAAQSERTSTSISQRVAATELRPVVDLRVAPIAFETQVSAVRPGEQCADPYKYTDAMKQAVDNLIARGGTWARQGAVLDFFLEKCVGINASMGIVGNTQAESGTNPTRHQVQGSAYGAFQHDGARRDRLMSIPGYQNLTTQLNFAWSEMVSGGMVAPLQQAASPEDGAVVFEQLFERAGKPRMGVRRGSARTLYNEFLHEYKNTEQKAFHDPAPAHALAASHAATPPAPAVVAEDFSKMFAENFQAQGASDAAPLSVSSIADAPTPTASASTSTGNVLDGALVQAIADNTPATPDVVSAVNVTPVPTHGDNTPHEAKPSFDIQSIISQLVATQTVAPVYADGPAATDGSSTSPETATPPIEAANLPAVQDPSQTSSPDASAAATSVPLPSTTATSTPSIPESTPATLPPIQSALASSLGTSSTQAASPIVTSLLTPTTDPTSQPSASTSLVVPAVADTSASQAPSSTAPLVESAGSTPDTTQSTPDQSLVPSTPTPISTPVITPPSTPAVTLPTLVAPVPAPVATTQPTPQALPSLDQRRQADINALKQSGNFNGSQANDKAPRTPLEQVLKAQGEQNGRLTNVERLGDQWGNQSLYKPAAEAFRKLNAAFKAQFGHDLVVNDSYRSYDRQVATKSDAINKGESQFAATPGESKHGWGLAIDLGGGLQSFNSPESVWMEANALSFGFDHPAFAAPGTSAPEPWHWEYDLSE